MPPSAVEAALQALLAPLLLPAPLVFANQNAPRPEKSFATLAVTLLQPLGGSPAQQPPDAAGLAVLTEDRRLSVEVQCFGEGAYALAQSAALRLRFPSHLARAEALGLSISAVRSVALLSGVLNDGSQIESRAVLEFVALTAEQGTDDVGAIEHVVVTDATPPGPEAGTIAPGRTETIDAPPAP